MNGLVLFTALDGSLLDGETGTVRPALPALDSMLRRGASVVPVSGRTASQIRLWMRHLALEGPFVSENGCSITLPKGYFPWTVEGGVDCGEEVRIFLGEGVEAVRGHLAAIASELGIRVRDLRSMSHDEIGDLSGYASDEVAKCIEREHVETFIVEDGGCSEKELAGAAESRGCRLRRAGPFYQLWKGCSKGEAVRILSDLYRRRDPAILTAAIGESEVDLPMLQSVDRPYLVQRPGGDFADLPEGPWKKVEGTGPQGWRMAAEDLLAVWGRGTVGETPRPAA